MARDALEEGDGTFPNWPRKPDGTEDPERMPRGQHRQKTRSGKVVIVDVTPRYGPEHPRFGEPIHPPTRPPS